MSRFGEGLGRGGVRTAEPSRVLRSTLHTHPACHSGTLCWDRGSQSVVTCLPPGEAWKEGKQPSPSRPRLEWVWGR